MVRLAMLFQVSRIPTATVAGTSLWERSLRTRATHHLRLDGPIFSQVRQGLFCTSSVLLMNRKGDILATPFRVSGTSMAMGVGTSWLEHIMKLQIRRRQERGGYMCFQVLQVRSCTLSTLRTHKKMATSETLSHPLRI